MAVSKYDLKFYLTSVEPVVEQTISSQSLGGYAAFVPSDLTKSLVYPETTLSSDISIYAALLTPASPSILANRGYASIDDELFAATRSVNNFILTRSVNGVLNAHRSGDIIRGLSTNTLFNSNFNESFKQYRCIAVRNNNSTQVANNVKVYIKQQSKNLGSTIRIAVEIPQSDYVHGNASAIGGSKRQMVSSSLAGVFADNHFATAVLRFTGGNNINQSRIITSSDSTTGIITVDSDFPFIPQSGDAYSIDPSPAQRIGTGITTPVFGTNRVSPLSLATAANPININVNGLRDNGTQFKPSDVFYIWLERSLDKEATGLDVNNVVVTLGFTG